jgi:hypothetical protein
VIIADMSKRSTGKFYFRIFFCIEKII